MIQDLSFQWHSYAINTFWNLVGHISPELIFNNNNKKKANWALYFFYATIVFFHLILMSVFTLCRFHFSSKNLRTVVLCLIWGLIRSVLIGLSVTFRFNVFTGPIDLILSITFLWFSVCVFALFFSTTGLHTTFFIIRSPLFLWKSPPFVPYGLLRCTGSFNVEESSCCPVED